MAQLRLRDVPPEVRDTLKIEAIKEGKGYEQLVLDLMVEKAKKVEDEDK